VTWPYTPRHLQNRGSRSRAVDSGLASQPPPARYRTRRAAHHISRFGVVFLAARPRPGSSSMPSILEHLQPGGTASLEWQRLAKDRVPLSYSCAWR
jgi:hypothetical protein